nr:NAD-dependent epimerase/dehydratase family protein [Pectobacterium sp. PL152]
MEHIVLSGATGFLGSHILNALIKQGYFVTILKRTTSDTWRIKHLLDVIDIINVDACSIDDAFENKRISTVIHTACDYGRNGQSISDVVKTNLLFGLDLLSSACKFNTPYFINTGSLLPGNINPYALSKSQFNDWLQHKSNEINVISLNLEHMYGPDDDGGN